MKKIKLLMPILGISTIASAAIPLASCNNGISLTSISIKTEPTKEFKVGETFSSAGLVVIAKYSDNSTKEVKSGSTGLSTNYDGKTFADADIGTDKTVTISYNDNNVVKTTTYKINVKAAVTEVELNGWNDQYVWIYSDTIDFKQGQTYILKPDFSVMEGAGVAQPNAISNVWLHNIETKAYHNIQDCVNTETIEIKVDGRTLTADEWSLTDPAETNPGEGMPGAIKIADSVRQTFELTTKLTIQLTFTADVSTIATVSDNG